jgi:hypothetical protein
MTALILLLDSLHEVLVKLDFNYWVWTLFFTRLEMLPSFVIANWVVVAWNIITVLLYQGDWLERTILATSHG